MTIKELRKGVSKRLALGLELGEGLGLGLKVRQRFRVSVWG